MKLPVSKSGLICLYDQLRILFPVSGLIHVGAGSNCRNFPYFDWNIESTFIFEANERSFLRLANDLKSRPSWRVFNLLIGGLDGDSCYHVASNPNESGIIPPEDLQKLWRNLKTLETRYIKTTSLSTFRFSAEVSKTCNKSPNWIFIECLPALPILQGSDSLLDEVDIVVVRVLVDGVFPSSYGVSCLEISGFLSSRRFRCVATEHELHPSVSTNVYVRDWKNLFSDQIASEQEKQHHLKIKVDEQANLLIKRQAQISDIALTLRDQTDQSNQMVDGLRFKNSQAELLIENLSDQEKLTSAELQRKISEISTKDDQIGRLQKQINELHRKSDRQADLLDERQKKIETLSLSVRLQSEKTAHVARDFQRQALLAEDRFNHLAKLEKKSQSELLAALSQLATNANDLAQSRIELQQLNTVVDKQADLLKERQTQVQDLALSLKGQTDHESQLIREMEQQQLDFKDQLANLNMQLAELQEALHLAQNQIEMKDVAIAAQHHDANYLQQKTASLQLLSDEYAELIKVFESKNAELEDALKVEHQSYLNLSTDCDAQTSLLRENSVQIESLARSTETQAQRAAELERERAEIDFRQRLLDQEIIKAEAQIELIKDVVLRAKAF